MKRWLACVLLMCAALAPGAAAAHELTMAEMEVRQISRTEFLWQWTASGRVPASQVLTPLWPEGCSADSTLLRCSDSGLRGRMTIQGVGKDYSAAIVRVYLARRPDARLHNDQGSDHGAALRVGGRRARDG